MLVITVWFIVLVLFCSSVIVYSKTYKPRKALSPESYNEMIKALEDRRAKALERAATQEQVDQVNIDCDAFSKQYKISRRIK